MNLFRPLSLLSSCLFATVSTVGAEVIDAADYGLVGDGQTDDGPVIQQMLDAAAQVKGPVSLQFPAGKTIYVGTAPERRVFRWDGAENITLDGGGSTFLLDPSLRFVYMASSRNMTLRRLKVDYSPLPFADGTVVAIDAQARHYDVRLAPWVTEPPLGGPTNQDGEHFSQPFFAMLWHPGPYGPLSVHCWVDNMEPGPSPGVVRVYPNANFDHFGEMVAGEWTVSLPVPGIAHRYGEVFKLIDNETVTVEDVELWSAPWFGFGIYRNAGELTFRRTHIRPKPGTTRFMSLWRDGFHVKGNSARLLWEDCELTGMNDDAFNISTHSSVVHAIHSPTRFEVRQKFPLLPVSWYAGSTLTAVDEPAKRVLGRRRITQVEVGPIPPPIDGQPAAPITTITLESPIEGLEVGTMVWDAAQCNPDTTLKGCTINMSCRMQSPVQLENCQVTDLLWFYGEGVEGGFPHHVRIENCTIRRGRGNPALAIAFAGMPTGEAQGGDVGNPPRAIHDVLIKNNEIWGGLVVEGVEHVRLEGNRFREVGGQVLLRGNHGLESDGNEDPNGGPLNLGGRPGDDDFDGNGLPDDWETSHGLNPVRDTADDGADGDPDGDGRTNAQELANGTNPTQSQSCCP